MSCLGCLLPSLHITLTTNHVFLLFPGSPHADKVEHHAGEARSEVRRSPSLWAGWFTQHSQDSSAHAAGRLPAARQRAHARRPAAVGSQFSPCGRSSATVQPPQQRLEVDRQRSVRWSAWTSVVTLHRLNKALLLELGAPVKFKIVGWGCLSLTT